MSDYETVCKHVGHLFLTSQNQLEQLRRQAEEQFNAVKAETQALREELARTRQERDQALSLVKG